MHLHASIPSVWFIEWQDSEAQYCTLYTVIDYIFPIIYDTVELEVVWLEYFKP